MLTTSRLVGVHAGRWWDPLRETVWRFAGVRSPDAVNWMNQHGQQDQAQAELAKEREVTPDLVRQGAFQSLLPMPKKVTITYISRQPSRGRKLTPDSHYSLVKALVELVDRRNAARTGEENPEWDFNLVAAEQLTRDEQIQIAARTTVSFFFSLFVVWEERVDRTFFQFLVGVHGNGLTHLVFMPPTRFSTVIEILYPQGFAHDYQWTSTALGMKHFSVWNDT